MFALFCHLFWKDRDGICQLFPLLDLPTQFKGPGNFLPHTRKEFLSGACPIMLSGIGGPGAPHHFEISRRENLGNPAKEWFIHRFEKL